MKNTKGNFQFILDEAKLIEEPRKNYPAVIQEKYSEKNPRKTQYIASK